MTRFINFLKLKCWAKQHPGWHLIECWLIVLQVHQVEMEGVVRGIQADMTKLSKSHSHTSNTVSKLLDKSRKLSVTMKEVKNA